MSSFHGGLDFKKMKQKGISADQVVDFSVSINPDPLPESVLSQVYSLSLEHYPDSECFDLRKKIAETYSYPIENLLVVNGTSQALFLIAHTFLNQSSKVLFSGPTYGEYRDAVSLHTDNIFEIKATKENDFYPDIYELELFIIHEKPTLFWFCNPNNPTGSFISESDFNRLKQACLSSNTLFILDEAYRCFVLEEDLYYTEAENVINLRSMTKDFSIPGLRLGYIHSNSKTIEAIKKYQPDWSVSSPAQSAGLACLEELQTFEKSWKKTAELTIRFIYEIKSLGYKVYPSKGNFFLFEVDRINDLQKTLWEKANILVRNCASFGLENVVRVGTRSLEDQDKLIKILQEGY